MITKMTLQNFRGVRQADFEIAPITVLTGANNSGKSTLMYGLLTAKNVVTTPNQPLDSFFNFIFLNLGGFKECVFLKEEDRRTIMIRLQASSDEIASSYEITLGKQKSTLALELEQPFRVSLALDVTFPYALNLSTGASIQHESMVANITWNGISPSVTVQPGQPAVATEAVTEKEVRELTLLANRALNWPVEETRKIDFVPLRRGFIEPIFSPVPIQPQLVDEKEIATLIANDADLEAKIDFYLEKVVNKKFRMRGVIQTANFYLRTTDRATGFDNIVVNDGFGTNQLVYLLAKALYKDRQTVCIEEPEIHLNPGAIMRLADVLAEIAKQQERRFIISTHSEHFVLALLNRLGRGDLGVDDLRFYYVVRDRDETKVEPQKLNAKGQIEGGLKAFYEAELSQLREFLRIAEQ